LVGQENDCYSGSPALQRPPQDDALAIVAKGEREDGGAA
jgi:hypothetical protein